MANRMSGEKLLKLYKAGERDFQDMNLSRISLKKACLKEANFKGANLQGANLQGANLQRANLEGANLKNANLEEANLVEAKFESKNLEGANLKWVSFENLSMEDYALKYESNIVWLVEDISKIRYVRPSFDIFNSRKEEIKPNIYYDIIVGYGEIEDDAPPFTRTPRKCFSRRLFWLKKEDVLYDTKQGYKTVKKLASCPSEAIDPLSVVKNYKGKLIDRCKGIENYNQSLYEEKPIQSTLAINPIENIILEPSEEILNKLSSGYPPEIDEITTAQEKLEEEEFFTPKTIKEAKERITISIARRQGQSKFRQTLLEIYNNRCAITGCDAQPALEAAHIIPYIETENNHPSNGLLLRGDLHTLFDLYLITINPETMQINLAPELHHTSYGELHRKPLELPKNQSYWPKKGYLQWRCEQCEWYR